MGDGPQVCVLGRGAGGGELGVCSVCRYTLPPSLGHFRAQDGGSVQLAGLMSSCDFLFKCPDETIGKEFSLKLLGKTLIDCWHHTPCLEFADYAE